MSNPSLRYQVYYTDQDKTPISIARSSVVTNAGDIVFIGKNRLEYGEVFNTNVLHLVENFACPEDPNKPNYPLLSATLAPLLSNPTLGQVWYNKTEEAPYVWNGMAWAKLGLYDTVAGNSGVIFHGQQLPKPVSAVDGYVYDYTECSWVVSPFGFSEPERIIFVSCYTDSVARVNMQFRRAGSPSLINGYATYQIIGIRDTKAHGVPFPTPNVPGLTPTPTPTPSITPTTTPNPTATITPTISRTPGPTRSATPTPTVTRTETPLPSITRTQTPTPTPTPTITATVTPSLPPPIYVDIYDQTADRSVTLPNTLTVGYSVQNTGFVIVYDTDSLNVPSQWLYNDDPANYSVRATMLSGNIAPTGFFDAWLNCATTRDWTIVSPATPGIYTAQFRIEIHRNVDDFLMDQCIVTLQVEVLA